MMKVKDLKPASYNPRRITDKKLEMLKKTMEAYGDLSGIVFNRQTGNLIGGHQRVKHLDPEWEIIKSDYQDEVGTVAQGCIKTPFGDWLYREVDWERQKEIAANIAANKGAGEWDYPLLKDLIVELDTGAFDMDLTGFEEGELKDIFGIVGPEPKDAEPQIDRAEEMNKKWQVKTGDLWQIGEHRLLCGDSTECNVVARLFKEKRARMIWTDPPYGKHYEEKMEASNPMGYRVRRIENDDLSPERLEEFLRSVLRNAAKFSIEGAAIYVACPAGTLLPFLIASFAGSGFEFRWGLIWLKDKIVLSRADYHFKHENILYGWKPDGAHFFTADRTQASVFEYPRPKVSEEHPTMKPVDLIRHMVRNSSETGDIVYDAFGGSGSTMLACENEKRLCRMGELSPAYCGVTLQRMADAFPGIEIRRIENGR